MNAKRNHFWKIPRENKELSSKIFNTFKIVNLVQIVTVAVIISILELYVWGPYFNPNSPYIYAPKIFVDSIFLDVLVLFCQYYSVAILCSLVFGYDFLYLSLCTELTVQVKLLKYELKEVFTKTSEDAAFHIGICVKQHNFLLS